MNPSNNHTVYIVDNDEAVRDSLEMLMRSVGLVSKSFESALAFLDFYNDDLQGCLILDIRMPVMGGLELQEELISRHSTLPIIFISGHGDIPMAVKAVKKGAMDFISKPFREQELLDCIQRTIRDTEQVQQQDNTNKIIAENFDSLSPREKQVLHMLIEGKANKVIAIELNISQRTVEVHRSHVMEKMQASSLAHLVKMSTQLA